MISTESLLYLISLRLIGDVPPPLCVPACKKWPLIVADPSSPFQPPSSNTPFYDCFAVQNPNFKTQSGMWKGLCAAFRGCNKCAGCGRCGKYLGKTPSEFWSPASHTRILSHLWRRGKLNPSSNARNLKEYVGPAKMISHYQYSRAV